MLQRLSLETDLAGTRTGGIILVAVVHYLVALVVLKLVGGGTGSADAAGAVGGTVRGTQGTCVAGQAVRVVTARAYASVGGAVGVAERNREVAHAVLESVVGVTLDALAADSGAVCLAVGDDHVADVVVQEQTRLRLGVARLAVARTVLGRTSFHRQTALVLAQSLGRRTSFAEPVALLAHAPRHSSVTDVVPLVVACFTHSAGSSSISVLF